MHLDFEMIAVADIIVVNPVSVMVDLLEENKVTIVFYSFEREPNYKLGK